MFPQERAAGTRCQAASLVWVKVGKVSFFGAMRHAKLIKSPNWHQEQMASHQRVAITSSSHCWRGWTRSGSPQTQQQQEKPWRAKARHPPMLSKSSCGFAGDLPAVVAVRDGLQPNVCPTTPEPGALLPWLSSAMKFCFIFVSSTMDLCFLRAPVRWSSALFGLTCNRTQLLRMVTVCSHPIPCSARPHWLVLPRKEM